MTRQESSPEQNVERVIDRLRDATRHTPYEGRLYLVGGLLRDRALGLLPGNDLDLMLEGDAVALAHFLYAQGLSRHYPVTYPRFGTAMLHIGGPQEVTEDSSGEQNETNKKNETNREDGFAVELVSARAESYQPDSRKPDVKQGTLRDDVFRRDFTMNTLLENLHTGETFDLTGLAWSDLRAGIIRTPLEPRVTFFDDPLRMLRAVRFAARFGFEIEPSAQEAIHAEAQRLRPPAIAYERIREEFVKIANLPGSRFRRGMELLMESNLLAQFLPEMLHMVGCEQGHWHLYDVWTHTLTALELLPDEAKGEMRLGLLWHDLGKPYTRSGDERGIHFYGHAAAGADLTRTLMQRLKFSNDEIRTVATLVEKHMRLGEYHSAWTDATVRRLIRDCGPYLDDLFLLARCDAGAAAIPPDVAVDLPALRARIDALNAASNVVGIVSPLDGNEIMTELGVGPGIHLKEAKEFLTNEVIEGHLAEGDRDHARELLITWWQEKGQGREEGRGKREEGEPPPTPPS